MQAATHPLSVPTQTVSSSKGRIWSGRIMIGIVVLFLLFDGVLHLSNLPMVKEGALQFGYPPDIMVPLGIIQLLCLLLYIIPRTSILGAILLTGYLGGAIATHVRVGNPLFSHTLFPVYLGILIWGGLYLLDGRLRALIPVRR